MVDYTIPAGSDSQGTWPVINFSSEDIVWVQLLGTSISDGIINSNSGLRANVYLKYSPDQVLFVQNQQSGGVTIYNAPVQDSYPNNVDRYTRPTDFGGIPSVSYTHLTLPTNREV